MCSGPPNARVSRNTCTIRQARLDIAHSYEPRGLAPIRNWPRQPRARTQAPSVEPFSPTSSNLVTRRDPRVRRAAGLPAFSGHAIMGTLNTSSGIATRRASRRQTSKRGAHREVRLQRSQGPHTESVPYGPPSDCPTFTRMRLYRRIRRYIGVPASQPAGTRVLQRRIAIRSGSQYARDRPARRH